MVLVLVVGLAEHAALVQALATQTARVLLIGKETLSPFRRKAPAALILHCCCCCGDSGSATMHEKKIRLQHECRCAPQVVHWQIRCPLHAAWVGGDGPGAHGRGRSQWQRVARRKTQCLDLTTKVSKELFMTAKNGINDNKNGSIRMILPQQLQKRRTTYSSRMIDPWDQFILLSPWSKVTHVSSITTAFSSSTCLFPLDRLQMACTSCALENTVFPPLLYGWIWSMCA
jgi:hypothetical protein